jgi:tetratricopeptide (TPR) repeat protein
VGNMGEVYEKHGDYARAVACHAYSLRAALEIGDWVGVSLAVWSMGKTYIWQERYEESNRLLAQAVALGRTLDIAYELCEYLHTQADLEFHQGEYELAQDLIEESGRIAGEVEHREVQFMSLVQGLRLRVALGEMPASQAIDELDSLLETWSADDEQADVHYQIWQLDSSREENRAKAAVLYRELYDQTPYIKYRYRYLRLSGSGLPDPAPLSPPPSFVVRSQVELDSLLQQVDSLISGLTHNSPAD